MSGGMIVSIISILAALVLAGRGLRNKRDTPRRMVLMAVAWVVIIAAVTFVIVELKVCRPV